MKFTKMQGAGNDYVYVDCFAQPVPADPAGLARAVADRRFGVGGDGLILIVPHDDPQIDAEMRMYNTDGSYSEMCGNGIRCVAKYVYDHGICQRDSLRIASAEQVLSLDLQVEEGKVKRVRVDMGEPILSPSTIPTTLPATNEKGQVVAAPMEVGGRELEATAISMGNPHCVLFVEEMNEVLVHSIGPLVEHHPAFPNRVNTEFVVVESPTRVRQRTWERGSGETHACGTGASAVCVAGVLNGLTERSVTIKLLGGDLEIEWNEADNHVYMTGPAVEVFSGDWPT